jgi:hypothetical protein
MTRTRFARSWRGEVVAPAPVEVVWAVVSDVTRTGEWSHECDRVEWLGGATTAAPGARFRGGNHAAWWRWSRTCEITDVSPGTTIGWRTIPTWRFVDSTQWRITLEPVGEDRTRIVQAYELLHFPRWWELVVTNLIPPHRDRSPALDRDLHRLAAVAAADMVPGAGVSARHPKVPSASERTAERG